MPRVAFEDIIKTYGKLTVLSHLDLAIDDGDFLVLLGPSGCGKTTLLNLLAGLLDITAGRIMIGDRDVTDLDPKDRGLAMVFQSYALYPTKTVYGNLKFGLAASKLPKDEIEKRIAWAARLLQIEPLLERKPAQLSGGQRQRVAIGRALVKNVDVFLFDEPLSNLDAKLRTEMRLEIKKLHSELNTTIVYVTHDQIEAMTMATKIAVMDAGVIQQFGTPDEIYERPANLFVAGFIGSPAMNLCPARLSVANGRVGAEAEGVVGQLDLSDYPFTEPPVDGTRIVLGLRPEHFGAIDKPLADAAGTIELPIQYAERTGSDATAYLRTSDKLVAVRIDPAEVNGAAPGRPARFGFLKGRANVFDAQSGRRM